MAIHHFNFGMFHHSLPVLAIQKLAIAGNASNASNLNYVIIGLVVIIVILIIITLFGNKK